MSDVVVLGSLNMDLVAEVPSLPAPGETVAARVLRSARGGKGANQAVAARRMGARVAMVGAVGEDTYGGELLQGLRDEGIDTTHVRRVPGPSGLALIQVASDAENTITVVPGANAHVGDADAAAAASMLTPGAVLLCQLEVPTVAVESCVHQARGVGAHVVLNAAPVASLSQDLLRALSVLVLNQAEVGSLTGRAARSATDAVAAAASLVEVGIRAAVVTLGPEGAVIVTPDGALEVPPFRATAVDTVGAGDAFVGALAAALAAGEILARAVQIGNAAGALAVERAGAQAAMPRRVEVDRLLSQHLPAARSGSSSHAS